jgi:hypothetical protein
MALPIGSVLLFIYFHTSELTVFQPSSNVLFHYLNIETEGSEAIVAANHRTHRVLHPSIVEVAFTSGQ